MSCPRFPSLPAERRGQVKGGNNLTALVLSLLPPKPPSPSASSKNHRLSLLSGLCWAQFRTVASGYLERIQTPTSCFYATVDFPFLALSLHPRCYENHVCFWKLSEESCPWWQHCVMKAASPIWAGLVQVQSRLLPRDSGIIGFPDYHPPQRVEAQPWSSFAIRSLPNLVLPYHYF